MAEVHELFQERDTSETKDERTHTRTFVIKYDSQVSTYTALNTLGVPIGGMAHPADLSAYVVSRNCRPFKEGKYTFIATIGYSNKGIDSPLNRPDEISWGASESVAPYFFDATGKPTVNSAGEAFENLLEREDGEIYATVVRNVEVYPVVLAYQFRHVVNTDSFTLQGVTIPAFYAKIGMITASAPQIENEITYQQMTIPIKIKAPVGSDDPKPWHQYVPDMGFEEVDGDGKRKPITNADGVKIKKQWPLDGAGEKKANADDDPEILDFQPYKEASFSVWSFA